MDNVRRLSGSSRVLVLTILILVGSESSRGEQGLEIQLSSEQATYAIREPVKFTAAIRNTTEGPLRIIDAEQLQTTMAYTMFEITSPTGDVQRRRFSGHHRDMFGGMPYAGERLLPNETLEIHLYPNMTWPVGSDGRDHCEAVSATFPTHGKYDVRLVYVPPEVWDKLYGAGQEFLSNAVRVTFREPTPEEREILDAYWAEGGTGISQGDGGFDCTYSSEALDQVLARHPDDPFARYAYFGSAVDLARPRFGGAGGMMDRTSDRARAIAMFEMLIEVFPDFRPTEVRLHLARAYVNQGLKKKARAMLDETAKRWPQVKNQYHYVWVRSVLEPGSMRKWQMQRQIGGQTSGDEEHPRER